MISMHINAGTYTMYICMNTYMHPTHTYGAVGLAVISVVIKVNRPEMIKLSRSPC